MRPGTALLTGLLAFASVPTASAGTNPSDLLPVKVTLELHETAVRGATSFRGSAWSELAVGETRGLFAAAGQLEGDGFRCGSMTGGPRGTFPSFLEGDGYEWRVEVSLEDRDADSAALRVAWTRGRAVAGSLEETRLTQELELRLGARRLLEVVPFEPPNDDPTCQHESYQLGLVLSPAPHAAMSDRQLVYGLWLARTRDGVREEAATTTLLADQAEAVDFTLPSQSQDGAGIGVRIDVQVRGTIRAWSTSPDTVAVQVDPTLRVRVGPPQGATRVFAGWGRGSKLYEARLGETVDLEIPSGSGWLTVLAEGLDLPAPLPDGVERDGHLLRLDPARLLGDERYSLLVRVGVDD
jgi:hypothetical protein